MGNKTTIKPATSLLTIIAIFSLLIGSAGLVYVTSHPAIARAAMAEIPQTNDKNGGLPADEKETPYMEEEGRLQDDPSGSDENLNEEEEKLFQETLDTEGK